MRDPWIEVLWTPSDRRDLGRKAIMCRVPETDMLLTDLFEGLSLMRAVLSKPRSRDLPARVTVDQVELRRETAYRFTTYLTDRATHENLTADAARERLGAPLADYGQAVLQTADADWQVLGQTVLRRPPSRAAAPRTHDRKKRYLLEEGTPVPFLVELGVMTAEGAVRKQHYDKFRQVNRFLELVDDVVPSLRPEGTLRVVDFGCGKSYLTFAIHHLLTVLRGRDVELVGLDLKEDVIASCAAFAERSRAAGLRFERGDIASFHARENVVSSSACTPAIPRRTRRSRRRCGGGPTRFWPSPAARRRPTGSSRAPSSRPSSAMGSPRSGSPRSSPTRYARSCWSWPATGRSWSSSSRSSTRRRTSLSGRSKAGGPTLMSAVPMRSCVTRSDSIRPWNGCSPGD